MQLVCQILFQVLSKPVRSVRKRRHREVRLLVCEHMGSGELRCAFIQLQNSYSVSKSIVAVCHNIYMERGHNMILFLHIKLL